MITINRPTVRASGDLHDSGGKFEAVGPQSEREARHLKPGVNRSLCKMILTEVFDRVEGPQLAAPTRTVAPRNAHQDPHLPEGFVLLTEARVD